MSYLSKGRLCPKKTFVILCYRAPKTNLRSPLVGMLQGQLNYWFSKKPQGFYKFLEPCKHPLYKQGDSWSEELGLSRRVFNSTFDAIGVRYKTKTEFMKAKDKFQGKLYASYHDRKKNQTFFVRNPELLQQAKKSSESYKSSLKHLEPESEISKKSEPLNQKIKAEEKRGLSTSNCRSRNDTNSRSYAGNSGGTIGGEKNTSKNTSPSSLSAASFSSTTEEKKKIANEMKNIWNEEIGEAEVSHLTSTLISRLNTTYTTVFKSSFGEWRTYCRKIASSKFLMGEGRSKTFQKVWITWAIKPESYERIQAGEFTLGDRVKENNQKILSPHEELQAQEDMKRELITSSHDPVWIQACLRLCERVGHKLVKEWLYPLNLVKMNSTEVELQAPNLFMRDWIHKNLIQDIKASFHELGRGTIQQLRITASSS
ncbi:MAG: hypothetical protein BGO76_01680 [Caedibacter sp. 38-128]|mgnify:CR=1 FL=1|nr:hypothetical protein [Holosporales bacterium]OJX05125.1 MAG: hypothetical protein BGO76_01680 [Caedibacter sp. 38-128]